MTSHGGLDGWHAQVQSSCRNVNWSLRDGPSFCLKPCRGSGGMKPYGHTAPGTPVEAGSMAVDVAEVEVNPAATAVPGGTIGGRGLHTMH